MPMLRSPSGKDTDKSPIQPLKALSARVVMPALITACTPQVAQLTHMLIEGSLVGCSVGTPDGCGENEKM